MPKQGESCRQSNQPTTALPDPGCAVGLVGVYNAAENQRRTHRSRRQERQPHMFVPSTWMFGAKEGTLSVLFRLDLVAIGWAVAQFPGNKISGPSKSTRPIPSSEQDSQDTVTEIAEEIQNVGPNARPK